MSSSKCRLEKPSSSGWRKSISYRLRSSKITVAAHVVANLSPGVVNRLQSCTRRQRECHDQYSTSSCCVKPARPTIAAGAAGREKCLPLLRNAWQGRYPNESFSTPCPNRVHARASVPTRTADAKRWRISPLSRRQGVQRKYERLPQALCPGRDRRPW